MKFRLTFTIVVCKIIMFFLRILKHGGTTLPGKIALKLYPNIASDMGKKFKVIMVTGTNGKTTTSRIIGEILEESNINYISNRSGANLPGGIVSTFIESVNWKGDCNSSTALLEIDEAAFTVMCDFVKPDLLVVTNFFKDQLDRYGNLYTTVQRVKDGIDKLNETILVLNADDPLCASLGKEQNNKTIYYGMAMDAVTQDNESSDSNAVLCLNCKCKFNYETRFYGHLGWFKCNNCGYERPTATITCTHVKELKSSYSIIDFVVDNSDQGEDFENHTARINLPGLYNVYNALAATACSHALNLPTEKAVSALSGFKCGFGRMETVETDGKYIKIILVKNPAGFNQVINYLLTEEENFQLAFALNDNLADGTDISWIWDVDFEELIKIDDKIDNIYTTGIRANDMAVRLKYSGIDTDKITVISDYGQLIDKGLYETKNGHCFYILPTYTAMLGIRRILKKRFGLADFWR